ncbi:MAG: hypothetical protein OXL37_10890 [Chloroflexota bacterium]|nr:hypothetical protein [Chloroflexota bacterium]MDE2959462.1 hypothetical protein [Chloroflexota bacterium]
MPKMTWQFPPNDAGEIEGPNDPGISHFTDQRDTNLIRESIQNSLDAKAGGEPVRVEFSLQDLAISDFEGNQLRDILDWAINSPHNDDKGKEQFTNGKWLLNDNRQLRTLCIRDSNTTGAQDVPRPGGAPSKWAALTKGSGSPVKEQKDAAGSFGLGKHSAFAVTDLRTVLYSTAWRDNDRMNLRFIGKTILVSHTDGSGAPKRRTGYLSAGSYAPLTDNDVPRIFGLRQPGTAIYIPGYKIGPDRGQPGWQRDCIAIAIDNYFHAIVKGHLTVKVGDDEVNADNIGRQYHGQLSRTANFIRVSKMKPAATEYFAGVGNVSLRIQVHEDSNPKVREIALVRDSGMMITSDRRDMALGLGRIDPHWRGFTAVIECISEPGESSYIRDSESPKHDRLSVGYIEDSDRRRDANNALTEIGQWVRERIGLAAGPQSPESGEYIPELVPYGLSTYDDGGEPGDTEKPATVSVTVPWQSPNTGGGAGLLAGEHGGRGGERRRTRNGGGSGGSGGRGGGRGQTGANRRPPVARVNSIRVQLVRNETHWVIAAFDNPGQELFEVRLVAVGEDGAEHSLRIQEAKSGDTVVDVAEGAIRKLPGNGQDRYQLEIKTNEPVQGKTFRLVGRGQTSPQTPGGSG